MEGFLQKMLEKVPERTCLLQWVLKDKEQLLKEAGKGYPGLVRIAYRAWGKGSALEEKWQEPRREVRRSFTSQREQMGFCRQQGGTDSFQTEEPAGQQHFKGIILQVVCTTETGGRPCKEGQREGHSDNLSMSSHFLYSLPFALELNHYITPAVLLTYLKQVSTPNSQQMTVLCQTRTMLCLL